MSYKTSEQHSRIHCLYRFRLPSILGYANAMELALTAWRFSSREAKDLCLVSQVFEPKSEINNGITMIAEGTKAVLLRSRELSVEQGLDIDSVATCNSAMLISNDLNEAISAQMMKRQPHFSKL